MFWSGEWYSSSTAELAKARHSERLLIRGKHLPDSPERGRRWDRRSGHGERTEEKIAARWCVVAPLINTSPEVLPPPPTPSWCGTRDKLFQRSRFDNGGSQCRTAHFRSLFDPLPLPRLARAVVGCNQRVPTGGAAVQVMAVLSGSMARGPRHKRNRSEPISPSTSAARHQHPKRSVAAAAANRPRGGWRPCTFNFRLGGRPSGRTAPPSLRRHARRCSSSFYDGLPPAGGRQLGRRGRAGKPAARRRCCSTRRSRRATT